MARVYDLEDLLDDLEEIFVDNLNDKILAISTEKGDGITIPPIDPSGYVQQSLNDRALNLNNFLLYGVTNISTSGVNGMTSNLYSLSIIVGLADDGNDKTVLSKMYRYQRALREVIEEHANDLPPGKMTVSSGIPDDFKALNTNNTFRVIGIFIEIAIS